MDSLRAPFLILGLGLMGLVLLVELGSLLPFMRPEVTDAYADLPRPGVGIPYLALVDGILLYSLVLMGLALVVPGEVQGRIQGVASLVFFVLLLMGSVVLVLLALAKLILMVSLLLAVPFGTIAYMAAYADFQVAAARATLGTLMALKLGLAVSLVLAHQRFLEIKGLVLLVLASLLLNLLVSFLHALGPVFVVSILDALAAIVIGVVAALWSLFNLVGSIMAVVKSVKARATTG